MSMHSRLLAAAVAMSFPIVAASAQLSSVGPVVPENGFPASYTDGQGTVLAPCLNGSGFCLVDAAAELLSPGQPFPLNYGGTFPDEFFY